MSIQEKIPIKEKETVCLIIPPSAFLLDERVFPSLGILKVAAALEQAGYCVTLLDLSGIGNFIEVLDKHLKTNPPKIVGITTTTAQLPAVMEIVKVLRRVNPNTRIILGGPHVTLISSALKIELKRGIKNGRADRAFRQLRDNFDILVSGDGELSILQAVAPNPISFIDADDHRGPYFLSSKLYASTPLPARHLIDLSTYFYEIEGHPATNLSTQLGCPYNCGFCGGRSSKSLRIVRSKPMDHVIQEVLYLYREYGYTGFMFYDDELNVNKEIITLMDKLSDIQMNLGIEFRFRGFIKAELFNDLEAQAMHRAGFRWILCGFESADPRILINMNKSAKLRDNTRVLEIAKRNNLKVKALMSCGHPGETPESIAAIRDWLVENEVDDFDCSIISPYPGTPYHDLALPHRHLEDVWTYTQPKTGDRLHAYEVDYSVSSNYYKGIPEEGYRSFVFTDAISAEEIVHLRDWVERDTRTTLGIPFNPSRPRIRYEHSSGQGLPGWINKSTKTQRTTNT